MGALRGRRLYVHVHDRTAAHQIEQLVALHEGIVDRFLSKEVHFLIVDENTAPKKPMAPPPMQCSRGKAFLMQAMKTGETNQTIQDPIQFAAKWKITCITVQEFLHFHNRYCPPAPLTGENRAAAPKGFYLQAPCVKFEDIALKYKPQVMQFSRYPSIADSHPMSECKHAELAERKSPKKRSKMPVKDVDHRKGFCEWCYMSYDSLDAHVKKKRHLKKISNVKEFAALDEVISQLPNMSDLLSRLKEKPSEAAVSSESGFLEGGDTTAEGSKCNLTETKVFAKGCAEPTADQIAKFEYSAISSASPVPAFDIDKLVFSDTGAEDPPQTKNVQHSVAPESNIPKPNLPPATLAEPSASVNSSFAPYFNPLYGGYMSQYCGSGYLSPYTSYASNHASYFSYPHQYPAMPHVMFPFGHHMGPQTSQAALHPSAHLQWPSHTSCPSLAPLSKPAVLTPTASDSVPPLPPSHASCPSLVALIPPFAPVDLTPAPNNPSWPSQPHTPTFDIGSGPSALSELKFPSNNSKPPPTLDTPPHKAEDDVPYSLNKSLQRLSMNCSATESSQSKSKSTKDDYAFDPLQLKVHDLFNIPDLTAVASEEDAVKSDASADKTLTEDPPEEDDTAVVKPPVQAQKDHVWIMLHMEELKFIIKRVALSSPKRGAKSIAV